MTTATRIIDCCPTCGRRTAPAHWTKTGDNVTAFYVCWRGHGRRCSWSARALGLDEPRRRAPRRRRW